MYKINYYYYLIHLLVREISPPLRRNFLGHGTPVTKPTKLPARHSAGTNGYRADSGWNRPCSGGACHYMAVRQRCRRHYPSEPD